MRHHKDLDLNFGRTGANVHPARHEVPMSIKQVMRAQTMVSKATSLGDAAGLQDQRNNKRRIPVTSLHTLQYFQVRTQSHLLEINKQLQGLRVRVCKLICHADWQEVLPCYLL